jgi:hypothetical protein
MQESYRCFSLSAYSALLEFASNLAPPRVAEALMQRLSRQVGNRQQEPSRGDVLGCLLWFSPTC